MGTFIETVKSHQKVTQGEVRSTTCLQQSCSKHRNYYYSTKRFLLEMPRIFGYCVPRNRTPEYLIFHLNLRCETLKKKHVNNLLNNFRLFLKRAVSIYIFGNLRLQSIPEREPLQSIRNVALFRGISSLYYFMLNI